MTASAGQGSKPCHTGAARPGEDARRLTVALRAWLKWHGLNQRDVAAIMGCSEGAVSVLINRQRTGRRDGALRRLVEVVAGAVGACELCGVLLHDGALADELGRELRGRHEAP